MKHYKIFTRYCWFILFALAACKEETVTSNLKRDNSADVNTVYEEILSLGFNESDIRDMGKYYLVEEDVYFSKEGDSKSSFSTSENKVTADEFITFTVGIDPSLASTSLEDKLLGAIKTWNSSNASDVRFKWTTSKPDISIQLDDNLPSSVAMASAFPRYGRVGSFIKINSQNDVSLNISTQQISYALSRCVGFRRTDFDAKKFSSNKSAKVRITNPADYVYIIIGSKLGGINKVTGDWVWLSDWFEGTQAMTMEPDGNLYIIRLGTLYKVNPSTGNRQVLTTGWEGVKTLCHRIDKLYAIQEGTLYGITINDPDSRINGTRTRISDVGAIIGEAFIEKGRYGITIAQNVRVGMMWAGMITFISEIDGPDFGVLRSGTSSLIAGKIQGLAYSGDGYNWFVHGSKMKFMGSAPGFLVNDETGGHNWSGTVSMVVSRRPQPIPPGSLGNFIYVIQGGDIYSFNPDSYQKNLVVEGYEGASHIAGY